MNPTQLEYLQFLAKKKGAAMGGGDLMSFLKKLGPEGEALMAKLGSSAGAARNTAGALGEKAMGSGLGMEARSLASKGRSGLENFGMKHGMMAEEPLSGGRYMTGKGKAAAGGAAGLGGGLGLAALLGLGDDDEDEEDLGI